MLSGCTFTGNSASSQGGGFSTSDAKVTVSNESRGINRQLTSNDSGIFSAVSLPPFAGYKVVVSAPGFNSFTVDPIVLEVGKVLFVDAILDVAGNMVQVNLEAPAPLVEPSRTDVSQVIATNQIMDLPINGRRVDSFVLLAPGVVPDGTFGLLSFRGVPGGLLNGFTWFVPGGGVPQPTGGGGAVGMTGPV